MVLYNFSFPHCGDCIHFKLLPGRRVYGTCKRFTFRHKHAIATLCEHLKITKKFKERYNVKRNKIIDRYNLK